MLVKAFLLLSTVLALCTGFIREHTKPRELQLRRQICNSDNNFPVRRDTVTLLRKYNITLEDDMVIVNRTIFDWYREEEWKN